MDVHTLAEQVTAALEGFPVPLRMAVMGCVVNGPGEAREADMGVASGNGKGQIFVKGKVIRTVPESQIVETVLAEAACIAEEQRRRRLNLIMDAADEVALPDDPEFRSAFVSYLEWGTRLAVQNSAPDATPFHGAPVPRGAGAWRRRTSGAEWRRFTVRRPAQVDVPVRRVRPQQGETRSYGVGAGGRWFAAARPELDWPLGAAEVLFGRRVQCPVRVEQVRAAESAQVGAARQQDGVDVVVGGDGADRDDGRAGGGRDLVTDPVSERGLVASGRTPGARQP